MSLKQSDSFNQNCFFWKLFGLWGGRTPGKYYKYFSFVYLLVTLIGFDILLIVNIYHAPRNIELLLREIIFLFDEITITFKVYMVFFKINKILDLFDLLDCKEFQGKDDTGKNIVQQHNSNYKRYLNFNVLVAHFSYMVLVIIPLFSFLFFSMTVDLPTCQYYFLSKETKNDYFIYIFMYQALAIYGHMTYDINIDTLVVGFMALALAQLKVLSHDLQTLKIEKDETGSKEELERGQTEKLHRCFKHYELVLRYCEQFQDLISTVMFVQYGIGSAVMCVTMCSLLLPSTVEMLIFKAGYFIFMNLQTFVPAWLGTQIQYESQDLMVAAYTGDWIPRSEGYKRSIRLFVERAKRPIEITGLKMFPLALSTYISIMKTAYSCFTLVRFFQQRQEHNH